jgi:predicted TIM-barrel fold metal-dependent hydrolase
MLRRCLQGISLAVASALLVFAPLSGQDRGGAGAYEFNDAHFHLTDYIQEGPPIRSFLSMMGNTVGRSTLFGIPLQQRWSTRIDGDNAPTYYLQTDAPLYYYSFTDAAIAEAYLSLSPQERTRFDPMITGFNPADMYAADHIRRVLQTFPGVFEGIGEFTIHKEFVSSKVAGGVASLLDPALDRILDFATEVGLVVLIHNDIDTPFASPNDPPAYLDQMKRMFRRHPNATLIWAHTGLGRVVRPLGKHDEYIEEILKDPEMSHVRFDISWNELAKYVVSTPDSLKTTANLINRYPDRFLFGTDSLAPKDQESYLTTYRCYAPLWPLLTDEARAKVLKGNYERIFDQARSRVRAWEASHFSASIPALPQSR